MTYNDFPILNSTDYQMLNNKYKEPTSTDRKTTIAKICVLLQECKNSCNAISRHINKTIKKEIEIAYSEILNILDNLNSNLTTQNVKEFNLFIFLDKLSTCLLEFLSWQRIEEKEYYKSLIKSNISTITKIIKNITSAVANSNVKIFKFM